MKQDNSFFENILLTKYSAQVSKALEQSRVALEKGVAWQTCSREMQLNKPLFMALGRTLEKTGMNVGVYQEETEEGCVFYSLRFSP